MRDQFAVVVHTVLWRGDQLLLLRRAKTGYLDGWYALPGGYLERGERVVECAIRECREETSLLVPVDAIEPLVVLPYRTAEHQGVNFIFSCRRFVGDARLAEPDLFDDLRWCAVDAMPERTVPYLAAALASAANGQWFREELE